MLYVKLPVSPSEPYKSTCAFAVAPVPMRTRFAETSTENGATRVFEAPIATSSAVSVRYVIVPPSVHFEAPAPIAESRSSSTSCTVVLFEFANSSKTPMSDAPESVFEVPTSFNPMVPIVKSPPELIVRLTTSLTVPVVISIPLIVSSVAEVSVPEAIMFPDPSTSKLVKSITAVVPRIVFAPTFTAFTISASEASSASVITPVELLLIKIPFVVVPFPDAVRFKNAPVEAFVISIESPVPACAICKPSTLPTFCWSRRRI